MFTCVCGSAAAARLAGDLGGLGHGLVHVVVDRAVRVAAGAAALVGVRARAVALGGVGARAVAVGGDAGAGGGARTGQAGHAGRRH